jgi:hypothetical protein
MAEGGIAGHTPSRGSILFTCCDSWVSTRQPAEMSADAGAAG